MTPPKNLPLILNLAYNAYNRGLPQARGVRGDFQPIFNADGTIKTTFCNQAIQYICASFGYLAFRGMMANEMVIFMKTRQSDWITVSDEVAQSHANSGVIVIAGWANSNGHGHVCLVLPGIPENSGSAGKPVPKVMNIGKDVFFGKKVSFAFKYPEEKPEYFALAGQII